ncbi:hypothetical protein [Streptomyces violens]|uniref:hypothetical protein n=1 Tax=Streptomyces violens TaxID=66377 RepID=UPI000A786ED5|nr:hypothetical protein [Streptomyces violens]
MHTSEETSAQAGEKPWFPATTDIAVLSGEASIETVALLTSLIGYGLRWATFAQPGGGPP